MLFWLTTALAGGLLYDDLGFAPLQDQHTDLTVTGRIANATVTYTFDAPPGTRTFTAVLPEGAAAIEVRANIDGAWASATNAQAGVTTRPSPEGDLGQLLDGNLFTVALPDSTDPTVVVRLTWQTVLAAVDGTLSLNIPFEDGGLNPSDPILRWDGTVTGIASVTSASANIGAADLSVEGAVFSGSGPLSQTPQWNPSWTELPTDFQLLVQTYRPPINPYTGEEDGPGYALVHLVPGPPDANVRVDTLTTFVLDASSSMQGRPMTTAVAAASNWLGSLETTDRFNVVPYGTQAVPFRGRAPLASTEAVDNAIQFLERQRPAGLSDPSEGLVTALTLMDDTIQRRSFFSCGGTTDAAGPPIADAEIRPLKDDAVRVAPYVVLLTDGGATVGNTDLDDISAAVHAANVVGASVFAVGVGRDVDRDLLERLTRENRGEVRYAAQLSDVDEAVAALQERIRNPLLVQPQVAVPKSTDGAPAALPDLTVGTELVYAFRYATPGDATLTLTGRQGQNDLRERHPLSLPATANDRPAVALAWAQLYAADLDAEVLAGNHTRYDELVRLVQDYGVSTQSVQIQFTGSTDAAGFSSDLASGGAGCSTAHALAAFTPLSWVGLLCLIRRRRQ